ncbi:hypothetical protein GCM10008959_40510 [Deinococcus seoulensis]|uniref:Uncharacterized protein n=1 Tax=Deinococcus seoulensis TaxID=1837379 RepID=A0ABQ2RXD4_9DEIO|nr:hypothetical protein GCM10008959_40510 [Deinococcus seoulensis]
MEKRNASWLVGMFPTGHARPSLPHCVIGGLIEEIIKYSAGGTVTDQTDPEPSALKGGQTCSGRRASACLGICSTSRRRGLIVLT